MERSGSFGVGFLFAEPLALTAGQNHPQHMRAGGRHRINVNAIKTVWHEGIECGPVCAFNWNVNGLWAVSVGQVDWN